MNQKKDLEEGLGDWYNVLKQWGGAVKDKAHIYDSYDTIIIQGFREVGEGYEFVTRKVYMGYQMEKIQVITGNMGWYLAEVWAGCSERDFLSYRCYWKLSV